MSTIYESAYETSAALAALIGPDNTILLYAQALDAIAPGCGDILRDAWRSLIADQARAVLASLSGAAHELEFYGGAR